MFSASGEDRIDIYFGDRFVDNPEIEKLFRENDVHWIGITLKTDRQQFKWKHDYTLEEHTLYVRQIICYGTEPCKVKFKAKSAEERSFGIFSILPPHIFKMECFLKFEEDVTFSLCGQGPVKIFMNEIRKEESWWTGVKKVFNKYTWERNYFDQSKEKND